jgi:hypothetical protein
MVEQQPSKLNTRVRFPSPAPAFGLSVRFDEFNLAIDAMEMRIAIEIARQQRLDPAAGVFGSSQAS